MLKVTISKSLKAVGSSWGAVERNKEAGTLDNGAHEPVHDVATRALRQAIADLLAEDPERIRCRIAA